MKLTEGTEVIIKRYENSTYNIQDSIFDTEGNYITKQSNLNVRNRFKNKDFKHNGIILKAIKWERI